MNEKETITIKICTLLAHQLHKDIAEVQSATALTTLGVDELDFIELIMSVEEAFSILITDNELADLHTIDDIAACVSHLQK